MAEVAAQAPDTGAAARRWIDELGSSEKAQADWLRRARLIFKKYRGEGSEERQKRRYAMLWSNTQTQLPAIYARPPEPVVTRRFKDADPVGRLASEVLERALSYSVDAQDLDGCLKTCSLDFVLIARGVAWERYVPTYGVMVTPKVKVLQVTTDAGTCYEDESGKRYKPEEIEEGEDGERYGAGESYRPVVFEQSITDYVSYEDFGHGAARTWSEVPYVWRRVFMTREQLKERFGAELAAKIPLDYPARRQKEGDDTGRKAAIYEIWDKTTRRVFWISRGVSERTLDERPDPLRLDGFFPCPRPLFGTLATDSLKPTPEYVFYQDQAEEIDDLTAKIAELQEALKVVGFYAGEGKLELQQASSAANGTLIAVPEWASFKDDGGARGRIDWWPIDQVAAALKACIELRAQLIEDVYQITGIADILRGASDPRETMGAQTIKAQWGSVRVRDRQKEMARFARDIIRIKCEVMSEHFSPETLASISGVQIPTAAQKQALELQAAMAQRTGQPLPPQAQAMLASPTWDDVLALLRDDAKRGFRIDIETDSTIEPNEAAEKAQTVEFMQAIGSMIQTWGPAIQAAPQLAPMAAAFIKFGARRFRAGRELETVIDQTMDQVAQGAAGPPPGQAAPPPEPPPDRTPVEVAQLNLQREQVKQTGEMQRASMQAGIDQGQQQIDATGQRLKLVTMTRDPEPQVTA